MIKISKKDFFQIVLPALVLIFLSFFIFLFGQDGLAVPVIFEKEKVQFSTGCTDYWQAWSSLSKKELNEECLKVLDYHLMDLENMGFGSRDCRPAQAAVANCPGLGRQLLCNYTCQRLGK
jgi:hypothetical protein